MLKLESKSIIITGGATGIGKAIAEFCKREGASVTIASRSQSQLDRTINELNLIDTGKCLAIKCDVTNSEQLRAMIQASYNAFGTIFGLICSAGVYGPIGPFSGVSFSDWESSIQINLIGPARTIFEASAYLGDHSRIILFSGGGQNALPNFSSYATSKGGIWRLTETLSEEFRSRSIYINAIAPGAVNTKFLESILIAGSEKSGKLIYESAVAQKKSGGTGTEKTERLVDFLLSPNSKGLSGKILSANWDNLEDLCDISKISDSEIYTAKRVIGYDGGTKFSK